MQYKIVKGSDTGSLEYYVNKLLGQGWKPQGGVSIDSTGKCIVYYVQAMVKE